MYMDALSDAAVQLLQESLGLSRRFRMRRTVSRCILNALGSGILEARSEAIQLHLPPAARRLQFCGCAAMLVNRCMWALKSGYSYVSLSGSAISYRCYRSICGEYCLQYADVGRLLLYIL